MRQGSCTAATLRLTVLTLTRRVNEPNGSAPKPHSADPSRVSSASLTLAASEWPCNAFLVQRDFGIPTLLFGPRGAGCHNASEYVELSSVPRTAEVYLAAALDWCC
jgi:hypothetical protein